MAGTTATGLTRQLSQPMHRIAVLGAGAVGKSAITIRMVQDEFRKEYDPTIEDSYTKSVIVDDQEATLDILDTAGQQQFAALQDHWIREAEGFLLVFSISSFRTFKHAQEMYTKIQRNKEDERIVIILVGNKSDLPPEEREVDFDMGHQFAKKIGVTYIESSAKTGSNVRESFEELVRELRKPQSPNPNSQPQSQTNKGDNSSCCQIL